VFRAKATRLIIKIAGHGDRTTGQFRVETTSRWQILWSYSCPQSVKSGLLVVENARAGAIGASITENGLAGHGITWLGPGRQTHRLIVISTCSWKMRVMQKQ
jgi:hypothetical protein